MATAGASATADALLDFGRPMDVPLLDAVVNAFYGTGAPEERQAAEQVLQKLSDNQEFWQRCDAILTTSTSPNTKFFALQVLESVIRYRWATLPEPQREGIKTFVSNLVINLAADEQAFRTQRSYVGKLNVVLVQLAKQDWPHRWPSFISDLVGAAKTSEPLCENCMAILKLVSEEVFDFSEGEMLSNKVKSLKAQLNSEFQQVYQLCDYVLHASRKPELVSATLETLHAYLSWVPMGYIFETNIVETILALFPHPPFRNNALRCITEVANLQVGPSFDAHFVHVYRVFMGHLATLLPASLDVADAYEKGSDSEQVFVQNLAMFFGAFFKNHLGAIEAAMLPASGAAPVPPDDYVGNPLLQGLDALIRISYVDDVETFKVCLDYWHLYVCDLYSSEEVGLLAIGGGGSGAACRTSRGPSRRSPGNSDSANRSLCLPVKRRTASPRRRSWSAPANACRGRCASSQGRWPRSRGRSDTARTRMPRALISSSLSPPGTSSNSSRASSPRCCGGRPRWASSLPKRSRRRSANAAPCCQLKWLMAHLGGECARRQPCCGPLRASNTWTKMGRALQMRGAAHARSPRMPSHGGWTCSNCTRRCWRGATLWTRATFSRPLMRKHLRRRRKRCGMTCWRRNSAPARMRKTWTKRSVRSDTCRSARTPRQGSRASAAFASSEPTRRRAHHAGGLVMSTSAHRAS